MWNILVHRDSLSAIFQLYYLLTGSALIDCLQRWIFVFRRLMSQVQTVMKSDYAVGEICDQFGHELAWTAPRETLFQLYA